MQLNIIYKKGAFKNMNYEEIAEYLILISIKELNICTSVDYIPLKNIAFQDCIICYN